MFLSVNLQYHKKDKKNKQAKNKQERSAWVWLCYTQWVKYAMIK